VNAFLSALAITMNDGVRKRFAHRYLDLRLASIRVSKVQNKTHQLIYKRGDGHDLTGKRLAQFNVGDRISRARNRDQRVRLRDLSDFDLEFARHHAFGKARILPNAAAIKWLNLRRA